jgi:translation elongation factor EF-Tu-like GTPase
MYELIKILANIELYAGDKMRKSPFTSNYRPLFDFIGMRTKISGRIDLTDRDEFAPGNSGVVQITFHKEMISDNYSQKGVSFTFGEGTHALGKGEIIEVISR